MDLQSRPTPFLKWVERLASHVGCLSSTSFKKVGVFTVDMFQARKQNYIINIACIIIIRGSWRPCMSWPGILPPPEYLEQPCLGIWSTYFPRRFALRRPNANYYNKKMQTHFEISWCTHAYNFTHLVPKFAVHRGIAGDSLDKLGNSVTVNEQSTSRKRLT